MISLVVTESRTTGSFVGKRGSSRTEPGNRNAVVAGGRGAADGRVDHQDHHGRQHFAAFARSAVSGPM